MRTAPLRTALLIGAVYDFFVGLTLAFALRLFSEWVPIPYPRDPIYARLCGILIVGLAGFYLATALTLPNSMPSVVAAIGIRTIGGGYLLIAPWLDPEVPRLLAVFGAVDVVFAVWLLVASRAARAPSY